MDDAPSLESFRGMKRIAAGGFGVVDEGVGPNGEAVAIKKELASDKVARPILEHEYHLYKALAGHECIPDVKAYGRQNRHNVMVMDLLGPSLGDRFQHCANHFSLRTTARLGLGMLDAIDYIHSRGFIHRDIKPENFLLGRNTKTHAVHPVDFGLARRWRHLTTGTQVSSSAAEGGVIGTLYFASIHAHLGQVQTRRDDLHALAYTILLFARGNLPWDHIRGGTRKHCAQRILEKKRSWTAARLCRDLPHELETFSSYCFGLDINEAPDYDMLRDNLAIIARRERWTEDAKFEWEEPGWTAADVPEPEPPSLEQVPHPCIKRGDVVFLKLIPEKSLDYEPLPRSFDPSFFPHQTPTGVEWEHAYRPAVVYPLMRRSGLNGLSTRRSRCFRPLETLNEAATGIQVPFNDIFLYKTTLLSTYKIEYNQATSMTSQLSVPEHTLARLEAELTEVPAPYSIIYDSDDEETRTIRRRLPKMWTANNYVMEMRPCAAVDLSALGDTAIDLSGKNGWMSEMIHVEEVRRMENGELDDDSDSDSDEDAEFWDWPRAVNRRLSCTVRTLRSC